MPGRIPRQRCIARVRGKKPMTARVEDDRNCNTGVTLTVTRARAEQVRKREQASASAAGMLQVCRAVCVRWTKRETVKPEPLESNRLEPVLNGTTRAGTVLKLNCQSAEQSPLARVKNIFHVDCQWGFPPRGIPHGGSTMGDSAWGIPRGGSPWEIPIGGSFP